MAWRIDIADAARRELDVLDRQIANRVLRFLNDRLASLDVPRSLGEALRGPVLGRLWKYPVGDHRIIADIRDQALMILVVGVGHGKDVYRR